MSVAGMDRLSRKPVKLEHLEAMLASGFSAGQHLMTEEPVVVGNTDPDQDCVDSHGVGRFAPTDSSVAPVVLITHFLEDVPIV